MSLGENGIRRLMLHTIRTLAVILWVSPLLLNSTLAFESEAEAQKEQAADAALHENECDGMQSSAEVGNPCDHSPPNIIFLLTDDQDVASGTLDYMPNVNRLLRREGAEFVNFFVPTGLCCPSRSTILLGQYCHNTEMFDNGDLNNTTYLSGAFQKFVSTGLESGATAATILSDSGIGYETALVGKYMNGYYDSVASHVPKGWSHWMGMTNHKYYGPHFSDNGAIYKANRKEYQTDIIRDWTYNFLTNTRSKNRPFFLYIAPFAPHAPATPAKRHEHLFPDAKAPRRTSYNPPERIQRLKPTWIKNMPPLSDSQMDSIDIFHRLRLQSLQAVDEMVLNITLTLSNLGLDDNTYVFYMGDNGLHMGDFRLPAGKRQPYDTDVRVPFLVRGPGVKGGLVVTEMVQSVDLLPTFLDLATRTMRATDYGGGVTPRVLFGDVISQLDGKSIAPLLDGTMAATPQMNEFRSVALLEMYGGSSNMGNRYAGMPLYSRGRFWDNTYRAIRVINGPGWASNADWLYVEWCTGEREFYDVAADPDQIQNLISDSDTGLLDRLSALTSKFARCKGLECHNMDFDAVATESVQNTDESMRSIFACHNPPYMTTPREAQMSSKRREHDLHVVEPFTDGFPFSDSDFVSEEELRIWEQYEFDFH